MNKNSPSLWHVLPDSYISAVGNVIVQWAYFEAVFNEWILHFMFFNKRAEKLGALVNGRRELPHPFKKRHKLFKDAAEICFSDCQSLVKKLHRLADQANSLHDFRDRVAHGTWAVGGGYRRKPATVSSSLIKGGTINHLKNLPIENLENAAQQAGELNAQLMKFRSVAAGIWPGWPGFHELTSPETQTLQDFHTNNLPKLPKPKYTPLPSQSSQA